MQKSKTERKDKFAAMLLKDCHTTVYSKNNCQYICAIFVACNYFLYIFLFLNLKVIKILIKILINS